MDWQDLLTACALYLVLEGLAPFLNPGWFRRKMAHLSTHKDAALRRIGLGSILAGLLLLYWVR